MKRLILTVLLAAGGLPSPSAAQVARTTVAQLEQHYSRLRHWDDRHRLLSNRNADSAGDALTVTAVAESLSAARRDFARALDAFPPDSPHARDPAVRLMAREWAEHLSGHGTPSEQQEQASAACGGETPASGHAKSAVGPLTDWIYGCFGSAAGRIVVRGETLNRLEVLGRLGHRPDSAQRRELFLSLAPVWRSINGDNTPNSPYRILVRLRRAAWGDSLAPILGKGPAWGLSPATLERWLVGALERWRAITPDSLVEPWDWYYAMGAASRTLDPLAPQLPDLLRIDRGYYRQLGADPDLLGVHYDIEPRDGKDPVAFTDFGDRTGTAGETHYRTEPWVFASYLSGGIDNLAELLHETGHAIHIAAIHTRPAYLDWPDNDTFTEALADVAAAELYEPAWQLRYLGDSATTAASLHAKYGGIMFDMAWALFEIRVHQDPAADPNRVWTDITSRYLHIRPHPEWSWWAMRGQLVDAPGYLINYALGAFLVADLRARVVALRGSLTVADSTTYPWLTERLYRFGRERPARQVLQEFLGRPLRAESLFRDLDRLR